MLRDAFLWIEYSYLTGKFSFLLVNEKSKQFFHRVKLSSLFYKTKLEKNLIV